MNLRLPIIIFPLLTAIGLHAASAQPRVDFERKKFDRSRFERPDPTARPALSSAAPTESFTPAAPTPMITEPPAAPSPIAEPTSIFSATSVPSAYPPPSPYPAGLTPEEKAVIDAPLFDQIPTKWFNNAKDHDDLVALQKKTGACLLVYFQNQSIPNEKGLCNWFEKTVTTDIEWRKAMKYYLKLEIFLPGNSVVEELVAKYRANKTPAFFVVKPGSTMGTRLKLFDYPAGSRPVPIEAALVLEALKAASTPAYQPLF